MMQRSILFVLLFIHSFVNAQIFTANTDYIYVLLNTLTENESDKNVCFDSNFENTLKKDIVQFDGYVYCDAYILKKSPAKSIDEFALSDTSVLNKALENWFNTSVYPKLNEWKSQNYGKGLKELKNSLPSIVPSQFIVIANGYSGLVVREYIQSKNYRDDIAQVLFF